MAEPLGVDEALVDEIASMAMEPEDGRIFIVDSDEDDAPSVTAFTRNGIDYLERNAERPFILLLQA